MILWKDENTTLFRSALYETISSVILTDDCVIVVDPCWLPHEVEEIKRYVDSIIEDRPLYLLFTHSDYDHIIGYKAFPEAKVIASGAFDQKNAAERADIIEQIKTFDDEYYVTRNYELVYPKIDIPIDGDRSSIMIGKTKLTFWQAPGHNDDGIFTLIEPFGIFITGDYFSDIEFPYIYFSSALYEETVLKLDEILAGFSIKLLVTGHGNPTCDRAKMKKRQQDSLNYIYKMREYVMNHNEKAILELINGCRFPRNMKKFHQNNKLLFEKELR